MRTCKTALPGIITATVIGLLLVSQSATGKLVYIKDIPNSKSFKCATCHMPGTPSKDKLNPFGKDFNDNGKAWNAAIAAKDSDGDGTTNGQELGDPSGSWKKGDTDITETAYNPGDKDSHK
jgi:hypothetical protein